MNNKTRQNVSFIVDTRMTKKRVKISGIQCGKINYMHWQLIAPTK